MLYFLESLFSPLCEWRPSTRCCVSWIPSFPRVHIWAPSTQRFLSWSDSYLWVCKQSSCACTALSVIESLFSPPLKWTPYTWWCLFWRHSFFFPADEDATHGASFPGVTSFSAPQVKTLHTVLSVMIHSFVRPARGDPQKWPGIIVAKSLVTVSHLT